MATASFLFAIGLIILNLDSHIDQQFPVLILAAGASSRLGRPKALLPLASGDGTDTDCRNRTLLDAAIAQGRILSPEVRVVCGAWYPLIRFRCRRQPSSWLRAPDWQEGISASLSAGLRSLGPAVKGVFVLVADQPLLDLNALEAFGKAARCVPEQPIAADYGGRPGVPAYLPRWLWPLVLDLEGDRGAGRLLAEVRATRVDIPGIHDDVDTPADWHRIRTLLNRTGQTARQSRR
ncbi:molybdenum cofactor cytidylyltransferase [Marinobacter sp. DSM 26671]|uniref:Nucleotide-diphospho-sugar transferase n=2 Tax=Marinobacter TaxID=2742 RepID=G6YW61_9GAMM|nr:MULTISPECIES: nucleotidyltransferase family protein [Marinobacter]MEC7728660.1 nucleotidyltransferase family protein [Pseudomonadota bacterium]EHJ03549.1 nucleotide-diphospho-sugar transferase [Marinobacter manganoxydans MnI7-9]MAK50027.1 nucleotidyltransferase family protein [Marinobacter sp.]MAM51584.1 nucleotidyltransferase family protein [Marinobacter sp.]MBI48312.1 nucleotidyltransferase family protein [Marinobacter sp.]